jgi:hypothetical protein
MKNNKFAVQVHQTQRNQKTQGLGGAASEAPGRVPWPQGEYQGAPSWLCLQETLSKVPPTVICLLWDLFLMDKS